jgi:hypothetical protein
MLFFSLFYDTFCISFIALAGKMFVTDELGRLLLPILRYHSRILTLHKTINEFESRQVVSGL